MNAIEYKKACWNLLSEFSERHRINEGWFQTEKEFHREEDFIDYFATLYNTQSYLPCHDPEIYIEYQERWDRAPLPRSISALLADYVPADMLQKFLQKPYDIKDDRVMWSCFQGRYVSWSEYWDEQELHFTGKVGNDY